MPALLRSCIKLLPWRIRAATVAMMTATALPVPAPLCNMPPLAADTVMVPVVSLFRQPVTSSELLQVDRVLFLNLFETAYHSLSPLPSRRSGNPSVFQGRRPSRAAWPVLPSALPQELSASPSLSGSGRGRRPGRGRLGGGAAER